SFGDGLLDLTVAVAGVDERCERFRALGHLGFADPVRGVVGVFVHVVGAGGERDGREVRVGVVGEFRGVFEPVGDLFQTTGFVVGAFHRFAVGVGDLGLLVGEVVFVAGGVAVPVFAFGEPVEPVVGVGRCAGRVCHARAVSVGVVFVFDGVCFAVGVAYFGESVGGVVGVGGGAFRGVGQGHEIARIIVFLGRFASERVHCFGYLAEQVAHVFRFVFVAVGLARYATSAIVAGFGDGSVGLGDLDRLIVGVVGICGLMSVGIDRAFEVAVGVVSVLGHA